MTTRIFSVIEYRSFYAIRYNLTGEERVMGDGVDALCDESDEPVTPGTDGFVDAWEAFLNADTHETFKAYFCTRTGQACPMR